MAAQISPEFRLVCACCRRVQTVERDSQVALAGLVIDWEKLLGIAERHRVDGHVAAALRTNGAVPKPILARLEASATLITLRNLALAAETVRLAGRFEKAGVPCLFLKGATLAMLAYESLSTKRAIDIDMLIASDQLAAAVAVLEQAGYQRVYPSPTLSYEQFERWVAEYKESSWRGPGAAQVDLHTSLTDNPLLIPGLGASSPRQSVRLGPAPVSTLALEPLFAFLCVHGAQHNWSRLKWLADLAALLSSRSGPEIERLYNVAVGLGAARTAGLALILCAELFGTAVPAALLTGLLRQSAYRKLRRAVLRELGRVSERESGRALTSNLPAHIAQFLLMPGWRYKAHQLRTLFRDPHHVALDRLPRRFAFLYPALGGIHKIGSKMGLLVSRDRRW